MQVPAKPAQRNPRNPRETRDPAPISPGTHVDDEPVFHEISVSFDAVLIMVFAAVALRYAMARKIDVHRRWALRTFMVVSGVWFTRVIYAFLGIVPGPTPGVADDMSGPTNIVIGFASYLLPLAVLELYFLARRNPSVPGKFAMAGLVFAAAVVTSVGVYGTAMKWLS